MKKTLPTRLTGVKKSGADCWRACCPALEVTNQFALKIKLADDDAATEGNPGITKANLAANASGAKVAVPVFGEQRPEGVTDFNDMGALVGLEGVAKVIGMAKEPDLIDKDWPTLGDTQ